MLHFVPHDAAWRTSSLLSTLLQVCWRTPSHHQPSFFALLSMTGYFVGHNDLDEPLRVTER